LNVVAVWFGGSPLLSRLPTLILQFIYYYHFNYYITVLLSLV